VLVGTWGTGTASVPTPVIGHNRELIREQFRQRLEVTAVARCAHDAQQRRAAAPDFVVELGPVVLAGQTAARRA
jgi:hypothetical protein